MRKHLPILALLSFGVATALFAVTVSVDYDHSANFENYKTYTWTEGTPAPNPLMQQRIQQGVEDRLKEEGLQPVSEGGDLQVVTHATGSSETVLDVDHVGYGGYPGWRGWGGAYGASTVNVRKIPVGTLMVDLVDNTTHQLVWRGLAKDTMSTKPETNQKILSKALDKMFKDFPPGPKQGK